MDAAGATTSKVTVQCTDSAKVLDTFEARFSARLPLRNLHWKSPSRPLRSIPSLNVTLTRDEGAQNGVHGSSRRHQIPGLRETPYVKLYLLRCDDKEIYKETARKEIKQWIKDNTLEKESKSSLRNQEHHDAFEWMVVHVVFPDTPAASQPKSSKHISLEATESTDSLSSKSKWTGKSPSTIYDKLRADFSSSKTSVPRVAQVRITEQAKPQGALSPAEIEEQWQELIDGVKACILKSFGTRVSQYEEDIKEREAQRSLPGWNFCTFFILKEGLARGFESLGLQDDALGVYDELGLGLDAIVKDHQSQDDVDSAGGLLPYSRDLKAKIRNALEGSGGLSHGQSDHRSTMTLEQVLKQDDKNLPFDVEGRQYRDLILSNLVSALDLRTYMFSKRMGILLARASNPVPRSSAFTNAAIPKDLQILADLMESSLNFITSASWQLRSDITTAYGGRLTGSERAVQIIVVGNMVATWTWSAIMQVLAIAITALSSHHFVSPIWKTTIEISANGFDAHNNDHDPTASVDHETSSSSSSVQDQTSIKTDLMINGSLRVGTPGIIPQDNIRLPQGGDRLAAWTARLLLLARNVLEELQSCRSWADELRRLEVAGVESKSRKLCRLSSKIEAETSEPAASDGAEAGEIKLDKTQSLEPSVLISAASSREEFHSVYGLLSQAAQQLLVFGGGVRAEQQVLLDLSGLSFCRLDYEGAADFLRKIVGLEQPDEASQTLPYALAMFAQCLKLLGRPNEYARCLTACLKCPSLHILQKMAQSYLDELLEIASLVESFEAPLDAFVEVSGMENSMSHPLGKHSFGITLKLCTRVAATFPLSKGLTLFLSAAGKQEPSEIIAKTLEDVEITQGGTSVTFLAAVASEGWYNADRLEGQLGNISLTCSLQRKGHESLTQQMSLSHPDLGPPALFVYLHADAVKLEMLSSNTITLGETRRLAFTITGIDTTLSNCFLRLRAGTAGLRLQTNAAEVLHDTSVLEVVQEDGSSVLRMDSFMASERITLEIPYTLENTVGASVSVKCQVSYEVKGKTFTSFETCSADVLLPISVNVQDVYRDSYWFSRFHLSPSTLVPIVLLNCSIEDAPHLCVKANSVEGNPMIFPQQPANWTVRLENLPSPDANGRRNFNLMVSYQCLDEVVLNSVKAAFLNDLVQGGFADYKHPLLSHLLQTVKTAWTEQDLEVAGLTREMEMWHEGDLDWAAILRGFDRSVKAKLKNWLGQWHRTRLPIILDMEATPIRTLRLAVELPPQPPVITTCLTVVDGTKEAHVVVLGQPLACELSITTTMPPTIRTDQVEFSFELFGQADAWLIGGRKKGTFSANEAALRTKVILFAQRLGEVLLPTIDIRCRRRTQTSDGATDWVDLPVEIHNMTVSKTREVTANLQSTTVGMMSDDEMHNGVGALLSARPRPGRRT